MGSKVITKEIALLSPHMSCLFQFTYLTYKNDLFFKFNKIHDKLKTKTKK